MYCSTLVYGVQYTALAWSMRSTSTEGPDTASTGSMMSSTEPINRVRQAVPAVQISEVVGVLRVSRVLKAVDISSARNIYSRNTASTLSTRVPPPKVVYFNSHSWDHP